MTDEQSPTLISVAPQFLVVDLEAACAFYVEKLGFRVAFRYGGFYAGVERDGVMIHLKLADAPDPSRELKQRDEHLDAFIAVDDVDELYAEYRDRGVGFAQPLADTPWGTREFVVWDSSGCILYFAQRAKCGDSQAGD